MLESGAWSSVAGREIQILFRAGTVAGLDDPQLLARFLSRRDDQGELAFAALVDRHASLVLRTCRNLLSDPNEAEDAAQAVFLVLARRASTIRDANALGSWLFGVALRVSRQMRNASNRRRNGETRGAMMASARREDTQGFELAERDETTAQLYEELERLPERYRRPLILCHLEGLTHQQAAERLGCPARTIHTRLTRGKARLRERLIRRGLAPAVAASLSSFAASTTSAAVSALWVESTARIALGFMAGSVTTTSAILAGGVLSTMNMAKIKAAGIIGGIACVVVLGLLPTVFRPRAASPITRPNKPITLVETKPDDQAKKREAEIVVLDAETGKPIEGASVAVTLDFRETMLHTDTHGIVKVDLSSQRIDWMFGADIWADGYVQQRLSTGETKPGKAPTPLRFEYRLHKGDETFGGTVKDEEGKPIPGVEVGLWGYLGEMKDKKELAYMVRVRTDDQGRWRCSSLRKMKWVYLYLSHPGFVSNDEHDARTFGVPNGSDDPKLMNPLRDFSDVQVMSRGESISGRVTDSSSDAIAGAQVVSADSTKLQGLLGNDLKWTTTDAEGRFSLPHVRPSGRTLIAKAKGYSPEMLSVNVRSDVFDANLSLKPAKVLAGKVVDSKGNPIEGAFVNVDNWKGFRGLGVYLATDKEGRFRWDEAPEDAVLMSISADGRMGISRLSTVPGENHVFTLRKALRITGAIRDLVTKKRLQDQCELEIGIVDPKTSRVTWGKSSTLTGGAEIAAWAGGGEVRAVLDAETDVTYQLRIKCQGNATFVTRSVQSDEGDVTIDVLLAPPDGKPLTGMVLDPDDRPAEGADVIMVSSDPHGIQLDEGKISHFSSKRAVKTDAKGQFSLPPSAQLDVPEYAFVVVHDRGYAEIPREAFEADAKLRLKPWGRIEGVYRRGNRVLANQAISYFADRLGNEGIPDIHARGETQTDGEGRFSFEHVPPGDIRVGGTLLEVKAGEVAGGDIGGTGRPVIAKVVLPEEADPKADYLQHSEYEIKSDRPSIPWMGKVNPKQAGDVPGWSNAWWKSPEGHEYRRTWISRRQLKFGPDLTIRVDDLPAGEYKLSLRLSSEPTFGPGVDRSKILLATRQFTIPEIPGGRTDEPLDLGVIQPGMRTPLKIGDAAPILETKTLDGKPWKLADFKGKFVLLSFWATWCSPCVDDIPELKAIREKFKGDDRFVMIGLSLDAEIDAARKFVEEKSLDWPQAHLGEWSKTDVPKRFGVDAVPLMFLIGPDGKIVASGLNALRIDDVVTKALKPR